MKKRKQTKQKKKKQKQTCELSLKSELFNIKHIYLIGQLKKTCNNLFSALFTLSDLFFQKF